MKEKIMDRTIEFLLLVEYSIEHYNNTPIFKIFESFIKKEIFILK